jgi:hypothetical protein
MLLAMSLGTGKQQIGHLEQDALNGGIQLSAPRVLSRDTPHLAAQPMRRRRHAPLARRCRSPAQVVTGRGFNSRIATFAE